MTRRDEAHPTAHDSTGHSGQDRTKQDRVLRNGQTRTKMHRKGQNKIEQDRKRPTTPNQARLIHLKQNRQPKQNLTNKTNQKRELLTRRHSLFSMRLLFFLDADECNASESLCDVNADCENTRSSYRCLCKSGFSGDGRTCRGIMMIDIFRNIIMILVSKLNLFMQMELPTFLSYCHFH